MDGHGIALGDLRLRNNGGENVVLLPGLLGTPGDYRRPEECEDGGREPVHLLPPVCWIGCEAWSRDAHPPHKVRAVKSV